MPVKSKEGKFLGLFDRIKKIQVARLNLYGVHSPQLAAALSFPRRRESR
jgi:hypothetical protein